MPNTNKVCVQNTTQDNEKALNRSRISKKLATLPMYFNVWNMSETCRIPLVKLFIP